MKKAPDQTAIESPPSSKNAISDWKRSADQVLSFLEEAMVQTLGARMTSSEAYAVYQAWARDAGMQRPVNRKSFTTRVESLKWAEAGKSTGGQRYLYGIRQRLAGDL